MTHCHHQDVNGAPCRSGAACPWYVAALEATLREFLGGYTRKASPGRTVHVYHVSPETSERAKRLVDPLTAQNTET